MPNFHGSTCFGSEQVEGCTSSSLSYRGELDEHRILEIM